MSGIGRNWNIFPGLCFYLFDLLTCTIGSRWSLLDVYYQINFSAWFVMLENANFYGLRTFSGFTNFISAVSGIPGIPGILLFERLKSGLKTGVTNNIIILSHSIFRNITIMTANVFRATNTNSKPSTFAGAIVRDKSRLTHFELKCFPPVDAFRSGL